MHPIDRNARKRSVLINLIQSQAAWFAAVLLAGRGHAWLATIVPIALTFGYVACSPDRRQQTALVMAAAGVGFVGDSILAHQHLMMFACGSLSPGLTAGWMVALWMSFATVMHGSLRWLQRRPALGCLLGAIGGPLAYSAGYRLGALSFPSVESALMAIALEWAIALPLLGALAQQLRRAGALRT